MTFTFKPAIRENAPVLVMFAGPSGSGKTFSALSLATGLAPTGKIAVIDTEAGRATHYADKFKFDHGDLHPPFSPARYLEAIDAADRAGYEVIVIDSMTHSWAGDGGCLDMQEKELDRMAGNDWAKRERVKMAAWIKPKMEHKRMMSRLLQCRAHIIMAFRAEEKVEIRKDSQGKQQIVPIGFQPICEKNMPYEATVSFLLADTVKHLPTPIKLQDQHKAFFPLDKPIGRDAGQKLAAWAKGGAAPKAAEPSKTSPDGNGHFYKGKPLAEANKAEDVPQEGDYGFPPSDQVGGAAQPNLAPEADAVKARKEAEASRDHCLARIKGFITATEIDQWTRRYKATINAMPEDLSAEVWNAATDRIEALSAQP